MEVSPGDYVTHQPAGQIDAVWIGAADSRFRVAEFFDSGFYDYDRNWCFLTLAAAQALSGAGDVVNV